MSIPTREEPPHCFGVENNPPGNGWDPRAVQCAGGADAAYKNPVTGTNLRDRCSFFDACGARVQAKAMERNRGLIQPSQLTRQNPPLFPNPQNAPTLHPQQAAQPSHLERFAHSVYAASQQPPRPQQFPTGQAPAQPPPSPQYHPQYPPQYAQNGYPPAAYPPNPGYHNPYGVPAMMPVDYRMPAYLSIPEERHEGQGLLGLMARTVGRSMGKALGHSIAHLFDTVPLTPPPRYPAGWKPPGT